MIPTLGTFGSPLTLAEKFAVAGACTIRDFQFKIADIMTPDPYSLRAVFRGEVIGMDENNPDAVQDLVNGQMLLATYMRKSNIPALPHIVTVGAADISNVQDGILRAKHALRLVDATLNPGEPQTVRGQTRCRAQIVSVGNDDIISKGLVREIVDLETWMPPKDIRPNTPLTRPAIELRYDNMVAGMLFGHDASKRPIDYSAITRGVAFACN